MMRYISKGDLEIVAVNSGILMVGIGIMCLVPIVIDLLYFEFNTLSFVVPSVMSIGFGYFLMHYFKKSRSKKVKMKHGMMISSLAWFWAGIIGGLVFSLATNIPIIDGIFESVSALTGTGITIYQNVEILPQSILFFRGFEQWIGGLGVIVVVLMFITGSGSISSKLYYSEAREEKLRPSVKATIRETLKIYLVFTVLGTAMLILAGMPAFDSLCNTFSLISTGGMAVKNLNIGYYHNDMIYLVSIVIMIMGSVSFLAYYRIIKTRGKSLIGDVQFQALLTIIAAATLVLYFLSDIIPMELLFTVTSVITTTGASVASVEAMANWPSFVLLSFMAMMLVGGSSGSTVGAIKLIRIITFLKGIFGGVREIISPSRSVFTVKINGIKIPEKAISAAGNFIALYLMFILLTWALFCLFGYDPFRSLFAAISLQGNNGLELGIVNHTIHPILKIVSMFDMWTGRLEIYPILIVFRAVFEVFRR
ncbi:TrkH family potassium uptake protein [Methanobrevibacter sp.]|uniref:TrkH family potassium uptake protein n=1 Tax=Methanobrevibacter sp. TaxID=66852 RepID=UPI00388ECDE1